MNLDALRNEVKLYKGIEDDIQDDLINLAISESIQRVLAKINEFSDTVVEEVPDRITFVVRDVAVKRYNRLNSEGASADSEEGRSFTWDGYLDEYENTLRSVAVGKSRQGKGITRFI